MLSCARVFLVWSLFFLTRINSYSQLFKPCREETSLDWDWYESQVIQDRFLWKWQIIIKSSHDTSYVITCQCPSIQLDVQLRDAQSRLVAKSKQRIFSVLSETTIQDQDNRIKHLIFAPRFFLPTLTRNIFYENGSAHTIQSSLVISSPDNTVLAYVEGPSFFTSQWNITDAETGQALIQVERRSLGVGYFGGMWNWKVTKVSNQTTIDPLMLLVILGQTTFQQMSSMATDSNAGETFSSVSGHFDVCNTLFRNLVHFGVGIFAVALFFCARLRDMV